jgi:hypothetical protein
MFAEDAGLLPKDLFTRVVRATQTRPELAAAQLEELFAKMRAGGFFGADVIKWFNGGLFDDAPALALERNDLKLIADTAAEHDWSQIDPAIFGTLFEEALKATRQRAALGTHYTDRDKILKIVDPVITRPLAAEWETAHAEIRAHTAAMVKADVDRRAVMERAAAALKLDPASARAGEAARRRELAAIAKARDAYRQNWRRWRSSSKTIRSRRLPHCVTRSERLRTQRRVRRASHNVIIEARKTSAICLEKFAHRHLKHCKQHSQHWLIGPQFGFGEPFLFGTTDLTDSVNEL